MKKIGLVLSFFVLISVVVWAKDSSNSINLKMAEASPKRVTPSDSDEILSFSNRLKKSMKSVVNIKSVQSDPNSKQIQELMRDPYFRRYFSMPNNRPKGALGSGVVLSKDGYIVTNNHVVENATSITVTLPDDPKEYEAKLIGTDKDSDLAVIKIDAKNLNPIEVGDSNYLKVGDVVFAVGNPFGVGETVTQGIVSALNKNHVGINQYENFIQTDASINPGNSGGALVDSRGALVGINSAILSRSGGNNGIGFAIPVSMVKRVVTSLISNGKVSRGYLGVTISDLNSELTQIYKHKKGTVVVNLDKNAPAYKSGFKRGDLIYKINDKDVKDSSSLKQIVASLKPGSTNTFYVERDKKDIKIETTLDSRDNFLLGKSLDQALGGMKLSDLNYQNMKSFQLPNDSSGVLIEDVYPSSNAERAGFQAGDVIIQIENINITNLNDLKKAINRYKNRPKRVYVNRYGTILMFAMR
ncbi:MAG: serine protease [Sulfurospirillum sp.]|nr:MAG: serine protease [Sulfurospirillum sp.]